MLPRPAIAYLRASTSKQKLSCDDQLAAIEEYCRREGMRIVEVFRDDGISGSRGRAGRAGWDALLRFVEGGHLSGGVVVVWSLDRWSRDFRAGLTASWIVGDYDVEIHSTDAGRQDLGSTEGQLIGALKLALAEQEVRERSRRVKERKALHAAAGFWTTRPPYGDRTVGERGRKALVADSVEAPIVRLMYNLYDQGQSFGMIAAELTASNAPTRNGGPWSPATVRTVLANPTYGGLIIGAGRRREAGMVEVFLPDDLRQRCRARAEHHGGRRGARPQFPLSGIVLCGACGRTMRVHSWPTRSGSTVRAYRCPGRDSRQCDNPALPRVERLEASVLAWWRDLCDTRTIDNLARDAVVAEHSEAIRAQAARRPLVDRAEDLDRQERNLVDAIREAGLSPVIRRELDAVRAARVEVEAALAAAGGDVDPIDVEAAVVQLQTAVAAVRSAQALRQYLDSIVVNPDRSVRVDAFGVGVTLGV